MRLEAKLSWLLGAVLMTSACQDGRKEPELASSAEQPGYALRYPTEIQNNQKRLDTQGQVVEETSGKLLSFPAELNEPDWKVVESVYVAADEEGRGQAYAQRYEEAVVVRRFFDEEKKPIVGRVAGGVQHAAKEKGQEFEAYGAVSFSLERALDKQLQERARGDSSAQLLIEEQAEALGKKNVEPLQDQADRIALASHIAHVRLVTDQQHLRQLLEESSAVRSALEDRKEELQKRDPPDAEGIQRIDEALATLEQSEKDTSAALEGAEQRAEKMKKDYEKAFDELLEQVRKKADETSAE